MNKLVPVLPSDKQCECCGRLLFNPAYERMVPYSSIEQRVGFCVVCILDFSTFLDKHKKDSADFCESILEKCSIKQISAIRAEILDCMRDNAIKKEQVQKTETHQKCEHCSRDLLAAEMNAGYCSACILYYNSTNSKIREIVSHHRGRVLLRMLQCFTRTETETLKTEVGRWVLTHIMRGV